MVWPLIIGAVASIGGAVAQYLNSAEGRRLEAAERQRLQGLLDAVKNPDFHEGSITPDQYQALAQYVPEAADYVAEKAPQLVSADSSDAKAGREAQLGALERLKSQYNQGGLTDEDRINLQEANASASRANAGRQGAISESFARRGLLGSGMEMAAQMGSAQQANEMAATNARAAALEAIKNRRQAGLDMANLGGQIRDADVNLSDKNAGIVNAFNNRSAERKQNWANSVAGIHNAGQLTNLQRLQHVSDSNTDLRNQAAVDNQHRWNQLQQDKYNNEMTRLGRQSNVTTMARDDIRGGVRDTNSAIAGAAQGINTIAGYADGYKSSGTSAQTSNSPSAQGNYLTDYDAEQERKRKQALGVSGGQAYA